MSGNVPSQNPLSYAGILANNPPNQIRQPRDPTPRDINANIGDEWENFSVSPSRFWKLASLANNVANWQLITTTGTLLSLSDTANTVVFPTGPFGFPPNNIQFVGGAGVTIVASPSSNLLTISASASGFTWNVVTSANNPVTFSPENGYIPKGGTSVDFMLPASSSIGDSYKIVGYGNLWTIGQNANQTISLGIVTSTAGVGGSVSASAIKDSIELTCVTANLEWIISDSVGNLTIV